MANPDVAFGFEATPLLRARPYLVGSTNATILYINDVVMATATGLLESGTAGSTLILGSSLGYLKVSTESRHPVADHPSQEFHAQDDGAGTTAAQTHIHTQMNHLVTAGSTYTRLSGHELDISNTAKIAAGWKLLDFVQNPEYSIGANSIFRCIAVEHILKVGTGTGI